MTKAIVEPPRRWVDERGATEEARLGQLFRAVAAPEALPPATLAKVHARLPGRSSFSPMSRRVREVVLAAVMLLAGSSLAIAGWGVHDWWQERSRKHEEHTGAVAAASSAERSRRFPTVRPSEAAPVSVEPSNLAPSLVASASAPEPTGTVVNPSKATTASADESALAAETAALERVLIKLRRERDAAGALALLDQSESLFARGALSLEAKMARVDALLMLGQRAKALAILDHLPLSQVGRGGELRVLRAELRAKDDCARALADFDVLVTQPLSAPLAERALYGRAACELQVGDSSHAQHDFTQYLSRFPNGRFEGSVRRELARTASKAP